MREAAFKLYLLFTVSWFLHLTARIPAFGVMRLDLLLVAVITVMILMEKQPNEDDEGQNRTARILMILTCYSIVTIPFVEWPGSVINTGLPNFIKAVVFYFFTVSLVTSEEKLRVFLGVFLACQTFRVTEPVYLHITQGYWGSFASMANWEYMERLSGAPSDIVNPNGLAFIIDSILPFTYFMTFVSWRWAVPLLLTLPALTYALVLTASRTGLLGMIAVMVGIWLKSEKKILLLFIFAAILTAVFPFLSADQKDRYLSIFSSNTKNAATAEGRTEGTIEGFYVALRRPIVGHGLGTSREANANFGPGDQMAHDLYVEIAQELGFVGLVIFLFFIKSIVVNFIESMKSLKGISNDDPSLARIGNAMQTWLFMNLLFSFASYGLSSYEWYLFAGFSVVLASLTRAKTSIGVAPQQPLQYGST